MSRNRAPHKTMAVLAYAVAILAPFPLAVAACCAWAALAMRKRRRRRKDIPAALRAARLEADLAKCRDLRRLGLSR